MYERTTLADSLPALKRLSSVRHCEPPRPLVCAVAEISERYGISSALTVIWRDDELEEAALPETSVTRYVPGATKTCDGFISVDVVPSPKFQVQRSGAPVERSRNCTMSPAVAEATASNDAATVGSAGAGATTLIVRVATFDSEPRNAVSTTL